MPKVLNPKLYEKIKQKYAHMKHSAYKSGLIVKEYKRLGGKYSGKKAKKKGLSRWFQEEWKNQRGTIGYKRRRDGSTSDIYRPTKRITKDTPVTHAELNEREIKRARKMKATKGRVKRFKLKAGNNKKQTQAKLLKTCIKKLKNKEKLGFTCTAKLKAHGYLPMKKVMKKSKKRKKPSKKKI